MLYANGEYIDIIDMDESIASWRYLEALNLPKFKAGLDRLLNKPAYATILGCHSVSSEQLNQFVDKAVSEGNAVLIEREYNGYMVITWKD